MAADFCPQQEASPRTPPAAILLTHDHPDHAGSTRHLVQAWECPVYVHPRRPAIRHRGRLDVLRGVRAVLDAVGTVAAATRHPWTGGSCCRSCASCRASHGAILSASSLKESARALKVRGEIPGLPEWESIPTPGHTPGHVTFFRPADRVLSAGDAVVTVDLNSPSGFLLWGLGRGELSPPPWFFTWSRRVAKESIRAVARLQPAVLAPGHGPPVRRTGTAPRT